MPSVEVPHLHVEGLAALGSTLVGCEGGKQKGRSP